MGIHRYYFFDKDTDGENVVLADGSTRFRSWVSDEPHRDLVRAAFARWKSLDIGLDFLEVQDRSEAEIRIVGTDLDVTIRCDAEAEIVSGGSMCVQARRLFDIVRLLEGGSSWEIVRRDLHVVRRTLSTMLRSEGLRN